jgi:hypothetical protein
MALFTVSGAFYVGGALGMEMVGGLLVEQYGFADWRYIVAVHVEESLEMFGASLFLVGLIHHSRRLGGRLERIESKRGVERL